MANTTTARQIQTRTDWGAALRYDPVDPLVSSSNEALKYCAIRDLTNASPGDPFRIWRLPRVGEIVRKQQDDGSWKYHGGKEGLRSREDYAQIETFRIVRELVDKYAADRRLPAFRNASEFLFTHQTREGDFRGIAGNQYVPYYSAAITELLVKGGYSNDPRIEKSFEWLLSMRQDDGGWAFPLRTVGLKLSASMFESSTVQPDRSKPFSHMVTGMVLRAFAAHPVYRESSEARHAGELLSTRFFQRDKYPDRTSPSFWTSFSYPFWFTDLVSSLDSLSTMGFGLRNQGVRQGLEWLARRQKPDGLWRVRLRIMAGDGDADAWISLAICRVFKRIYGKGPVPA